MLNESVQPASSNPLVRSDQQTRRHWLCIAYAFPPILRSGTHRTLGFVRHLSEFGWDATVLTVEPVGETLDESPNFELPPATQVLRTKFYNWIDLIKGLTAEKSQRPGRPTAPERIVTKSRRTPHSETNAVKLNQWSDEGAKVSTATTFSPRARTMPNKQSTNERNSSTQCPTNGPMRTRFGAKLLRFREWLTHLLILPDSKVGWVLPAVRRGLRVVRRTRPELIYSSSPCLSAHLIGWIISRWTRVPWIADFRDPWRDNPFRRIPFESLDRLDAWLERRVLLCSDHVVFNTAQAQAAARRRFPFLNGKSSTILNGFDPDRPKGETEHDPAYSEASMVGNDPPPTSRRKGSDGPFVLIHAGEFYGPRRPHALFSGLRSLASVFPELAQRVRLLLIGPEYFEKRHLYHIAEEKGVADQIQILGKMSHSQTRSFLAASDALLVVGSAGPGSDLQVPNKLFEYLGLRRPILALVSPSSPVRKILLAARADALECDPSDEKAIGRALADIADPRRRPAPDAWSNVGLFERRHRAAELVRVFEGVLAGKAPQRSNKEPYWRGLPAVDLKVG